MYPRSQGTWVEARDRPAGENQMKLDRMIGNISQVCRFGDLSDDIPALAIGAIGKINQTNPEMVRGIDSVPAPCVRVVVA